MFLSSQRIRLSIAPFLLILCARNGLPQSAAAEGDGRAHAEARREVAGSAAARQASIGAFVENYTRQALGWRWRDDSRRIARAILVESRRRSFDPLLIMAMIQNESQFRVLARGRHGEIGLMQLKPSTGRWIAKIYGLRWQGKATLRDPVENIRIGAAYLALLREEFEASDAPGSDPRALYLSAYNMGIGKLHRAIRRRRIPHEYASRVMRYYWSFHFRAGRERDFV